MADCAEHTDDEKRQYREDSATIKARDRPSKFTSSQTPMSTSETVGRLQQPKNDRTDDANIPSCRMTIHDVRKTLNVFGRCDDGSDETLAYKELAEKSSLKNIGKLDAIETVRLKVALTKKDETTQFPFSRAWTVPSTVLHLSSGRLALKNIKFLLDDDDNTMVCEDLLIGLPVLRHLRVDT